MMSAFLRNPRASVPASTESGAKIRGSSPPFVRLSQLRKLSRCDQAAAVCYRVRHDEVEFLLVHTSGGQRWTFPKGSAERGLTHAQAAALEAFEEAGVRGRMEEAPFAQYVHRLAGEKSSKVSCRSKITVNAHLCEVLRLSPTRESNRDRTWFSVQEARQRLREGRGTKEGNELVRVVNRAVERIHAICGANVGDDQPTTYRHGLLERDLLHSGALQKNDALRKVKFDFAEAYGWGATHSSSMRARLGETQQTAMAAAAVRRGETLPCEILEFDPPKRLKLPK
jgi:8-oxo-dGTP pyrophosphatase MutT (NUDIX family)